MTDKGAALSALAKQAPFVDLTAEEERQVDELTRKIKTIFDAAVKRTK